MWAASGVSWYVIHKYNIFKFFAKHLQVYFSNFNFITGVLYLDSMLTLCIAFTARLCLKIVKDSMSLTGTIIWVGSHLSAIGGGPCRVCKQKGNWELAIRNNEINCLNNTGSMGELDHILELLSFLCSVKGKLYSFQNKRLFSVPLLIIIYILIHFLIYVLLGNTEQVVTVVICTVLRNLTIMFTSICRVTKKYITAAENTRISYSASYFSSRSTGGGVTFYLLSVKLIAKLKQEKFSNLSKYRNL